MKNCRLKACVNYHKTAINRIAKIVSQSIKSRCEVSTEGFCENNTSRKISNYYQVCLRTSVYRQ